MSGRFLSIILALSLAAAAIRPAAALDVLFELSDKLGKPIPAARICYDGPGAEPGQCRETDSQGRLAFSPAVGLDRPHRAAETSLRFLLHPGYLIIETPIAVQASITAYTAAGRLQGSAARLALREGSNPIPLPGSNAALRFFRIETEAPGLSARRVYRIAAVAESAAGPRLLALGKAAAANLHAFAISKDGYQGFVFRPRKDVDTARIRLASAGDTGIPYAGIIRARVTAIDTAGHELKYAYTENACNGSTPVARELAASLPLWIRNGKWYFPAGNCFGVALSKSGGGLLGSWASTGLEPLPAGLFPVTCDPERDSIVTSVPRLFFLDEGGGWNIDLGADSLTIRIRRRICPGNQLITDAASLDGRNGRPLLVSNVCTEVALKNDRGDTAAYAFPVSADSVRAVYTYADKTCATAASPLILDSSRPRRCPEAQAAALMADTLWQNCVKASGFVQ